MKVVINCCYGGFHLSDVDAATLGVDAYEDSTSLRTDPRLVDLVERGAHTNSSVSELKVVEIPDDVQWHIEEYDGNEWVAEDHRTWS